MVSQWNFLYGEYFVEFCDRDFECIVGVRYRFALSGERERSGIAVVAAITQQRKRMR